jgi:hypothetical protein
MTNGDGHFFSLAVHFLIFHVFLFSFLLAFGLASVKIPPVQIKGVRCPSPALSNPPIPTAPTLRPHPPPTISPPLLLAHFQTNPTNASPTAKTAFHTPPGPPTRQSNPPNPIKPTSLNSCPHPLHHRISKQTQPTPFRRQKPLPASPIKPNQTQQPFPFVPFALFVVHPIFHSRTFASIRGSLLLHTQAFNAARPITTPVTLQGVF